MYQEKLAMKNFFLTLLLFIAFSNAKGIMVVVYEFGDAYYSNGIMPEKYTSNYAQLSNAEIIQHCFHFSLYWSDIVRSDCRLELRKGNESPYIPSDLYVQLKDDSNMSLYKSDISFWRFVSPYIFWTIIVLSISYFIFGIFLEDRREAKKRKEGGFYL